MKNLRSITILLTGCGSVAAQAYSGPSQAPLTDTPSTPYGVDWQTYFRVNDTQIPFAGQPRIFSGSLSVNRTGHANNTLFFMGFEKEDGSMTAGNGERADQPWMIYIAGGPGSAASAVPYMVTGPTLLQPGDDLNFSQNPYAWNKLVDMFYIDQPVGVGFSTADPTGFVVDEDQMGEDFTNFLRNLGSVFPSLKTRPLYLLGESYGGVFVPYIAKTIFAQATPPVNLSKLIIAEGAVGSVAVYSEYPALGIIQTYPQLVDFDPGTYEYFVEQYNLCGYNVTLEYPAPAAYPPMKIPPPMNSRAPGLCTQKASRDRIGGPLFSRQIAGLLKIHEQLSARGSMKVGDIHLTKRQDDTQNSPHLVPIGRINPYFQCAVMEEIVMHAALTVIPWKENFNESRALTIIGSVFNAVKDQTYGDPSQYYNTLAVQASLHAPNKKWEKFTLYPFNNSVCYSVGRDYGDPSIEPQVFLSDLAARVPIVFYAGSGDANVGFRGTELSIQNFTFGGIRGFTARPSTPFSDGDGNFAGIIHTERNVTYALFKGAGHGVAWYKPNAIYTFIQQFVLGTNQTGLMIPGGTSQIGGVHTEYLKGILTGSEVYTGSGMTQGTYTWPKATWDVWGSYMAARTAADVAILPSSSQATALRPKVPGAFMLGLLAHVVIAMTGNM